MENKVEQTAKNEYSNIPPKFYCEFCGSELLEGGRCPVEVYTILSLMYSPKMKKAQVIRCGHGVLSLRTC